MKTELKAKFLQNILRNKKEDEGFTLIELLVVIIIIGILSAIALPSFLNQANKAKQSEAKTYIGSMNRGQQAYFLENSDFTTDVNEVGIGIKTQTELYDYKAAKKNTGTSVYVVNYSARKAGITAPVKDYLGKVHLLAVTSGTGTSATTDYTSIAFMCETNAVGAGITDIAGNSCPTSTKTLK
ncbi:type IV pilin-like G/H family protein [Plectonema cf. radiosum LEGE 06105]|uniref:Type IV pilin-like G/H family protein n=1 Tax=Plectonema cf. radiosum LEGE 06105 TaxID=945769 RepID=A0A8J7F596_9CYAN|nr:type IV pilin-like G/H family protein [Plectonema radiosum]MBE9213950.1 type IV pilin-like G/H family protein [Plectonema cf. radiosum LEGE 06105]